MSVKLNRGFFEEVLGEKISAFKFSQGSKKGDGVAGGLKCITIDTEAGAKHSYVVKFLPTEPSMLAYAAHCRIMETEADFYGPILNEIRALLKSRNMNPERSLPFVKSIAASDIYLVLEDIRPQGYRMADKYVGLSPPETFMALTKLGEFHALTHCLIREKGEKMFRENSLRESMLEFPWGRKEMGDNFHQCTQMLERMIVILKEQNPAYAQKMSKFLPNFLQIFTSTFSKTDKEYFPVICHGDFWLNNFLFRYDEKNQPEEVRFIDLQQVHRGNIFEDLMYFYFTSTTPAFRKDYLIPSLEVYYRSFAETMQNLKCPLPIGFTQGFLIDHYYKNLLCIGVFVGGAIAFQLGNMPPEIEEQAKQDGDNKMFVLPDDDDEGESDEIILIRPDPKTLLPAWASYDGLGDFCEFQMRGDPRAIQRFLDIIEELDHLGLFD